MITIYTDGSSKGNPGPGGWGSIIIEDNYAESGSKNHESRVVEIGGREDHTTNNRMELTAAIETLKFLDSRFMIHDSIKIYTDSEYVMKGITEWIKNWQAKGWRTAGKKKVLNQDLWQELLRVTDGKKIEWRYVRGHVGDKLNERADEIATTFADNLSVDLYDGPLSEYK